jgi:hypothetical protein
MNGFGFKTALVVSTLVSTIFLSSWTCAGSKNYDPSKSGCMSCHAASESTQSDELATTSHSDLDHQYSEPTASN